MPRNPRYSPGGDLPLSLVFAAGLLLLMGCHISNSSDGLSSEPVRLDPITERTFRHLSYLEVEGYGRVGCNGLVAVSDGEAVIYDSPPTTEAAEALIRRIEGGLKARIVAVIATHFHDDCLGGIRAFRDRGIPTYASEQTRRLAEATGNPLPEFTFRPPQTFAAGDLLTIAEYPGAGHTRDNLIGYVPEEKVLFGGCLLKADGAGKGNLADADTLQWATTVTELGQTHPTLRYVVPGHGQVGGPELLRYTAELFSTATKN